MAKLEDLNYAGFAFAYLEDGVQFTSTSTATCCCTPQIVEYMRSVIVASELICYSSTFHLTQPSLFLYQQTIHHLFLVWEMKSSRPLLNLSENASTVFVIPISLNTNARKPSQNHPTLVRRPSASHPPVLL